MDHKGLVEHLTYLTCLLRHARFCEVFDPSTIANATVQHFPLTECGPSLSLSFWETSQHLVCPSQRICMVFKSCNQGQCYHISELSFTQHSQKVSPHVPSGSSQCTRSVQKISSHVLWKIETFTEEDIRSIVHRMYIDVHCTSVSFKAGTLKPHIILTITISCPVIFSWISLTAWNLFPFKGDFSFGKSQKCQGAKTWM